MECLIWYLPSGTIIYQVCLQEGSTDLRCEVVWSLATSEWQGFLLLSPANRGIHERHFRGREQKSEACRVCAQRLTVEQL